MTMITFLLVLVAGQSPGPAHHLSPSVLPQLSADLQQHLKDLGCTIPQGWYDSTSHNVVSGYFRDSNSRDTAVLCSRAGESSILVFAAGESRPYAELAASPDTAFVQAVDADGTQGFSRVIEPADRELILRYRELYGRSDQTAIPIEHEGINDAFVEKASIIHYLYNGQWLRLPGAD